MKQKTQFQSESQIANLTGRYNDLIQDVVLTIQERLTDNGEVFDLDSEGIEDEIGNDITGVNNENVYNYDNVLYSLHELNFWDGINIISAIDNVNAKAKQ